MNDLKTLIIDNYDSYTFNLLQLFRHKENIVVIRNDQFAWDEFTRNVLPYFDNVIISPGPGRPEKASDFGICTQLLQAQADQSQSEYHRPIFGICLGHQGIGHIFGGQVTYAPRIMHGRMSQVHVVPSKHDLLADCASPFWAVRYHSLVVDRNSLPDDLELTGYCSENEADTQALKNACYIADRADSNTIHKNHFLSHNVKVQESNEITVMAFRHKKLPLWGVQFHPESVSTEHGKQIVLNFQRETLAWKNLHNRSLCVDPLLPTLRSISAAEPKTNTTKPKYAFRAITKTLPRWVDPVSIIETIGDGSMSWLDSSRKASPYSQRSILCLNPAFTLSYSTFKKTLTISPNITQKIEGTFFDYLSDLLDQTQVTVPETHVHQNFHGGLIGYFGYEMKCESLEGYHPPPELSESPGEPDAAFQFVDKFMTFDHHSHTVSLWCLIKEHAGTHPLLNRAGFHSTQEAHRWMESQEKSLSRKTEKKQIKPSFSGSTDLVPDVEKGQYLESIDRCVQSIHEGDAYEICLTTRFRLDLPRLTNINPLYTHHLRKNNPAPFSALIKFDTLTLMSSSPERFLNISTDHQAEMKPIKGTIARVLDCVCDVCDYGSLCEANKRQQDEKRKQELWQDVKERAENLMIVDLIRNDLSQVCEPNSVHVPKLMHVETYEKVHHLVSTIRGQLYPQVNSVRALQRCFPPGSMTGAPKLRAVQLLDQLEEHRPRGAYSGCIGYFSLSGGADFNVVIRTAVVADNQLSVGGGGAITFLSKPEQEWKEAVLKTRSVAPSVIEFLNKC
ncbi:ADC synthase [Sporodiniella umbellata]|nr:ADC synthase [Sporodiniella umbellata]